MTITQSLTWWVLVVPMSVLGACAHAPANPPHDTSAIAVISNMLPVDGCSYPVTIDGVDYAPDARSLAAIDDRVPAGGELRVRIEYRLTGRTGQVECGFGTSRQLPEITFRIRQVLGSDDQESPP
ncbi:MAG TPA: hypothetical protein VF469_08865 [Kofleriaceae bacterium]